MKTIFIYTLLVISLQANAQEIAGRILDDEKEPLISAAVQVLQDGLLKTVIITDYDGNYDIRPLDPGYYDVLVIYPGLDTLLETGVLVSSDQMTNVNATLIFKSKGVNVLTKVAYKKPLVDPDKPPSRIGSCGPDRMPTNSITDLVSLAPGVYQSQRPPSLNIGGSRSEGTTYIIDGIAVQGVKKDAVKPKYTLPENPDDYILTNEEINHLPYNDINDMASLFPGVYQARRGGELHVFGSR